MEALVSMFGLEWDMGSTLMAVFLIMVRLSIVIAFVPFLFGEPVPNIVRLGLSFMFTFLIFPQVQATIPAGVFDNFLFFLALVVKEGFYGLAIALAAGFIFFAFDAAGQVIDNQRGASMAQLFSPQTGEQVTIFGAFNFQLAIVLFLTLGGHRLFMKALFESFILLPIYEMPAQEISFFALMDHFISISGAVLMIAAQLTAPILISIFVVDIILGFINRISPAVNVMEMGFAIRAVVGVIIFFVAFTVIAHQMQLISQQSIDNVTTTIKLLAGG